MEWHEVQHESDLTALMERFGEFHDGCLREVHIWTGTYVSDELRMSCPADLDVKIRMLFQRQYRDPSAIELRFEQVTGFHLAPSPENYDSIIFDATLKLREDGTFLWSDCPNLEEVDPNVTWVTGRALWWRD